MTRDRSRSGVSRRNFLVASGAAVATGLAGCTENPSGGSGGSGGGTTSGSQTLSGSVSIAGSSTVFPLAVAMRKRFLEEHPDVDVSVKSTGSGGGFANYFCPGNTDFNNASRPIKPAEQEQCSSNGVEPVELKVATDALTVVTHPEADWFGDGCITMETLAEIWSAESKPTTWSDIDSEWPDEEIQLFGPTDASGTFDYFKEAVLGEEATHRSDYQATEQDNQIISGVSRNEYAVGYLGYAYYSENKDRVKALALDGGEGCVAPKIDTARTGEYPLSRPLFTYAAKDSLSKDQVAAFAKFWVENSTSTAIVADAVGYVPNSEQDKEKAMQTLETAISEATQ
ncbi:MAG: PstS family phosphate ABC transporter substrate-binding protein [Haloferacaceae archaeon]